MLRLLLQFVAMQTPAKWVSGPHPQKWAYKKDMPEHIRHEAYRVDFGIFGVGYIARDMSNFVLMPNGHRAETFDFYLRTPGHVIGYCDSQAASHLPWALEWQTACSERRLEQFKLRVG